jgi:hypothetical protein
MVLLNQSGRAAAPRSISFHLLGTYPGYKKFIEVDDEHGIINQYPGTRNL